MQHLVGFCLSGLRRLSRGVLGRRFSRRVGGSACIRFRRSGRARRFDAIEAYIVDKTARHVVDLNVGIALVVLIPLRISLLLGRRLKGGLDGIHELRRKLVDRRDFLRSVEHLGALDDMDAIARGYQAGNLAFLKAIERGLILIDKRRQLIPTNIAAVFLAAFIVSTGWNSPDSA